MSGYKWKRGDTTPANTTTLVDRDGQPVNLVGATVSFHLAKQGDSANLVTTTAEVVDAAGGKVRALRSSPEMATVAAGVYRAEYEVIYSGGQEQTFPEDGYIHVEVDGDLG